MSGDDRDRDLEPEIEISEDLPEPPATPEPSPEALADSGPVAGSRIIAIGAGRGGAGRSLLAANIAIYLAQTGKKVIAIDADPAGGPLHQLLGAARPPRGFGEFLRGRAPTLAELVVDTPIASLSLVSGEGATLGSMKGKVAAKGILAAIRQLAADYIVVDLGPADATQALDLWLGADFPVAVTLPDPASIEATYRLLKSAFVRKLRSTRGLERLVANPAGPPPAALDIYRAARDQGGPPGTIDRLRDEIFRYRPRFIVNQTRSLPDLKLGVWMATAAQRRLGHTFEYLGHVESDETVWLAARRRRPLVAEYPESKVAKNIERIARRLLSGDSERAGAAPTAIRLEEEQTHYEILETEPGVSDEEVRRAYRTLKEIYAAGSPVIAGLYDEHELGELHARANAAHDTLFAPERRRLYDLALPEADLARAVRAAAQGARRSGGAPVVPDRAESPEPVLEIGEEVTGPILRKIRVARGLELGEISQRTKISERHLRSIEEERFGDMPAAVYVRGFVTEFARALRIDAQRAAESYLRRFHARNSPPIPPASDPPPER
ncbi:MAG TPA: helix-turn-helix domain-containing protein [Polyangia bacterium]|nr:helix-turn-helix domain-containing protein [Polyangia bacterium]